MSANVEQHAILVVGATGNQGGAVVNALLVMGGFMVLAATRNLASGKAAALKAKGAVLVEGDLDDCSALLAAASKATTRPVWGVFSVQAAGFGADLSNLDPSPEVKQGTALIDAAVAADVHFFVYASAERGGNEASWDNVTRVGMFATKHKIEHYLRDHAGSMGWTILRPTSFMENLAAGRDTAALLGLMHNILGDNDKVYWVSLVDIGRVAAMAFADPEQWNHKAFGLAGDRLTLKELETTIERATGSKPPVSAEAGQYLEQAVPDIAGLVRRAATGGFNVDIEHVRSACPQVLNLETWAREYVNRE